MDWEPEIPGQFETPPRVRRKRSAADAGFSGNRPEGYHLAPASAPQAMVPEQDWFSPIASILATSFRILHHLCSVTASRIRGQTPAAEQPRRIVEIRRTTSEGQESVKRRATEPGRAKLAAPIFQQIARSGHQERPKKTSPKSPHSIRNLTMTPSQETSAQSSSPTPPLERSYIALAGDMSHLSSKEVKHREALAAQIHASFTPRPLPGIADVSEAVASLELAPHSKESEVPDYPAELLIVQEPLDDELETGISIGDYSPQVKEDTQVDENSPPPTHRLSHSTMDEPSSPKLIGVLRSVRMRQSYPSSSKPGMQEIFARPRSISHIPKQVRFATNPLSGLPHESVKFYKESMVGEWAPSSPWAEEQAVHSMSGLDTHLQSLMVDKIGSGLLSKNGGLSDKLDQVEISEQFEKLEMSRLMREKRRILKKEREIARATEAAAAKARAEVEEAQRKARSNRRIPKEKLVQPLNSDWEAKIEGIMHKGDQVAVTTSVSGTEIRRRDLMTVLGEREWLNDEIINAYIDWIVDYANEKAGKNGRTATPKVIAHSSFFYHNLATKGPNSVSRWMKRKRAEGKKLLDVETILIPVNNAAHWTIIVVSPKSRTIEYLDSFSGPAKAFIKHTMDWLAIELGDAWHEEEWTVLDTRSAEQLNGYDCGVFAVTNAECVVGGLDTSSYGWEDMAAQRRRIAGVLLNRGFGGDFVPAEEL